jgi:hypothetical protein
MLMEYSSRNPAPSRDAVAGSLSVDLPAEKPACSPRVGVSVRPKAVTRQSFTNVYCAAKADVRAHLTIQLKRA